MQNAESQFLATRYGFGYGKPKLFLIKPVLIKKNPLKHQLLDKVNKRVGDFADR